MNRREDKYDHLKLESKWQKAWEDAKLYQIENSTVDRDKKMYVLPQLPYPSGAGLHVGHAEGYTACDIVARYNRMKGKQVLQVIGWDSFGLPAENYAIKNNIHPSETTNKAVENFRYQIRRMGMAVDWSREVGSHQPEYYKWTQWFFLLMYKRGLAYRKKQKVNWCESCKTVLANEQVIDGKCERCETEVMQKDMEQWYLKITDYADRLYDDLDKVDWPEETVINQRNWIGRRVGAEIGFKVVNFEFEKELRVFTTRPDTLMGVTFLVVAPELVAAWIDAGWKPSKQIYEYVRSSFNKTDMERQIEGKVKTGVDLGLQVIHPVTGEQIPIWVADYVLSDYGTGAVMGVPGHDERDFVFAKQFGLPVIYVVRPVFGLDQKHKDAELRHTVSVILRRDDGKVAVMEWKEHNWLTPIIGGVEDGETVEKAALREVKEETGWDAKVLFVAPFEIASHYFADHKKVWRERYDTPVLCEVVGTTSESVVSEEANLHTVRWMSVEQAIEKISFINNKMGLDVAVNKRKVVAGLHHDEKYELINSGEEWNGWLVPDDIEKVYDWLEKKEVGRKTVSYKLRDWSVSRQRFWGAPIPMVYDDTGELHPVNEEDLPIKLPSDVDFMPTGQSPLTYSEEFQQGVEEKYGKGWKREVDTLDTFMCSSWYYFRYIDPHNDEAFANKEALKNWMPVDFYIGGPEHTNGHLLYSRFFTKVLYDAGYIDFDEPFLMHRHQGMILGEDNRKMSKRWGNIVNPTEVMDRHGGDTMRMYEMFMGPLSATKAWNTNGEAGIYRFLQRVWRLGMQTIENKQEIDRDVSEKLSIKLQETVLKVTNDIEDLKFNTAISAMMEFVNDWSKARVLLSPKQMEIFLKVLAPFAPYLTEELWSLLGNEFSIHQQAWPEVDSATIDQPVEVTMVIQINGKVRGEMLMSVEDSKDKVKVEDLARDSKVVQKWLKDKEVKRVIVVPQKLVNMVVA